MNFYTQVQLQNAEQEENWRRGLSSAKYLVIQFFYKWPPIIILQGRIFVFTLDIQTINISYEVYVSQRCILKYGGIFLPPFVR